MIFASILQTVTQLATYYPDGHETHLEPDHPERPQRLQAIRQRLEADGLWGKMASLQSLTIPESTLFKIHTSEHVSQIHELATRGGRSDSDTYLTSSSFDIASKSAGGAAAVASGIWNREFAGGFALCRPPGHHATSDTAMGFCLLNNVALAAQFLIDEFGARRVAIIDIDLHHGNGTQDIFYSRDDVAFFSIHEWPLYPGSGRLTEIGDGAGQGLTVNLPLPRHSGDRARDAALEKLVLPCLERYNPEIILISLGLDAHWRDPLGNQVCTAAGYAQFLGRLREWTLAHTGRDLALFLEGGYDLEGISESAALIVRMLLGEAIVDRIGSGHIPESDDWQRNLATALAMRGLPGL